MYATKDMSSMLCILLLVGFSGDIVSKATASDAHVYFIDAPQQGFLRSASDPLPLTADGMKAVVASLLAVDPPRGACHEEAEAFLQGDVFHRPGAVATIHVAGLSPGEEAAQGLKTIAGGSPVVEAAFQSKVPAVPGTELVMAVAQGTASPVVQMVSLDTDSLVGCDDACTEAALQDAAKEVGATYLKGAKPMQGRLQVGEAAEEVTLDLSELPVRLLAAELAGLYRSSEQQAPSQEQLGQAGPRVLEAVLVGLQAVRSEYGRESPQYKASWQLLSKVLAILLARLRTSYEGRLVMQVAVLGEVPNQARGLKQLLQWGQAHRRRSLLSDGPPLAGTAEDVEAQKFADKAAAVVSFLLFLLFLVSSFRLLGGMQFKHDSLLYGRSKTD